MILRLSLSFILACLGVVSWGRGLGAYGVLVCPIFSPPCYITKKGGNPGQALASSLPEITLRRVPTHVTKVLDNGQCGGIDFSVFQGVGFLEKGWGEGGPCLGLFPVPVGSDWQLAH